MAGWILLTIVPIILGVFMANQNRPKNMGRKKALRAFTIAYPQKVVNCMVITAFLMVGVVALTAYMAPDVLTVCSAYYIIYVIVSGFVVGLAILLGRRAVSFNCDKIEVTTGLFGKPAEYSAADLVHLDIRKTDVRAMKEDGSLLFSAGVMMENLDLFFAWTHERPYIKLTMNGKALPQKGGKPQDPDRKPN